MNEVKHTPGPWFVTGSMTKYIEARIPSGLIQEVAACGPTEADGGYGPQQQANAKLIAAAPDLLDALIKLHESLESLNNSGDAGQMVADDVETARAAIAKATQ